MFIIYDLIFLVIAIIYLPIYLLKKKFHRGFFSRLGILPKKLDLNRPIWIHAVSVGEAVAIRGLITELRLVYPGKQFVISTVTPTGNKIAGSYARETDFLTYLPLDFSFIVRGILDKINPCLFVIAETEIWPNLISCLDKKKIPVIIVNGRISDRSFGGYQMIKFLISPILNKLSVFCVQTQNDSERLRSLGVLANKIRVAGNMKFDQADYADNKIVTHPDKYRGLLGLANKEKLWVCGSTHAGEEEIILSVYKNLLKDFSTLKLLIAPRHPERAAEVEKLITAKGLTPCRVSRLGSTDKATGIFILDTVGELPTFYTLADIVFVGGSLVKKGGHNILEPAAEGKPILFGPHMFNFRDIADLFLNSRACVLVNNARELEDSIKHLLNNPSAAQDLSRRAQELVQSHKGATGKYARIIKDYLKTAN